MVDNLKCCLMKTRKDNGEIDQSHKFVTQSHYPCDKQHFSIVKENKTFSNKHTNKVAHLISQENGSCFNGCFSLTLVLA
jgi:hypothetical protein